MKNLLLLLVIALSFQVNAQMTLNDVTLPATLNYSNTELSLNGGGIRTKLIFKLYTAGLYLQENSSNATTILNSNEPMAIRMVITSSKINSDNMSEAIREGFDKSTDGNTSAIEDNIDVLIETFSKEAIVPGDIFDLVYIPGKGVMAYKNSKLKSTISDLSFKKALYGIWLSDNPISSGLKDDLLGN